jgi:hypothetical protein
MKIKFDFHEILFLFLSLGLLTIMLFGMSGCSANYHLNKFQDKGGVCGKIDTIRVTKYDTITNTYYHFDSLVVVNDRVVPLTRTEIRYNERLRRDTINHKETIIKYLTKAEIKKEKAERKTKTAPWKIGIVILALIALIVFLLKFR